MRALCRLMTGAAGLMWAIAAVAAESASIEPGVDYHSFANVGEFRVRHFDLDLTADFTARTLAGTVELDIKRLAPAARALVLDTRNLDIRTVSLVGKGRAT